MQATELVLIHCALDHFGQTPTCEVVLGWFALGDLDEAEVEEEEAEEEEEEEEDEAEEEEEEACWLGGLTGGGITPTFLSSQYSL